MADGVIISSDDESDCEALNSSIFLVEMKEVKNNEDKSSPSVLDEDLMVTFSQRPEVLPHARYDCPIHPFMATDCETSGPVGNNQLTCDQCFCYICDKLASQCLVWCEKGVCHCNSHKRNEFWSNQRNTVVLGYLETFNLSLSEIDTCLRNAETMLQNLKTELEVEVSSCLRGEKVQEYGLNQSSQQGLIRDYTRIYECVSSFLRKADEQEERAAAIMRLGAARELTGQFQPSGAVISSAPETCATKIVLLQRIITSVQRQMVMADFTSEFINKLQSFYQRLKLPSQLRSMRSSLSVRPWNDVLLVSVLKGQNVTGVRKHKGKKDILFEEISVVLLRIELLQHQHRYRELYRYLRVVQTDHSKFFQEVQDLLPFFLCKAGDLTLAMSSFFISCTGPASRLSPYRFLLYLRIFDTATAPVLTSSLQLDCPDNKWEPIEGTMPLKRVELVKFSLRVQQSSPAVYSNSQCWECLLNMISRPRDLPTPLPEPSPAFMHNTRKVAREILFNRLGSNIQIPRFFIEVNTEQALLLLVTEALAFRILEAPLIPTLPVINTFKENVWAFQWLCDSLSSSSGLFLSFMQAVTKELESTAAEKAEADGLGSTRHATLPVTHHIKAAMTLLPLFPCPPTLPLQQHAISSIPTEKHLSSKLNGNPKWLLPYPLWHFYRC